MYKMEIDLYRISLLEFVNSREYKEISKRLKGKLKGERSLSFDGGIMNRGLNISGKIKRTEFRKKGSERELLIDTGMERDLRIKIPVKSYSFYYNTGDPVNVGVFFEGVEDNSLLVDYNYTMFHKRYLRVYNLNQLLRELKNRKSESRIPYKNLRSQHHFWNCLFYFNKWSKYVGFNWKGQKWFGNRKPHLLREYRLVGELVFSKLWDKHRDGPKFHNVWLREKKKREKKKRLNKEGRRKDLGIFGLEKRISLLRERIKKYLIFMNMSYNVPMNRLMFSKDINLLFMSLNLFIFRRQIFLRFVVSFFENLTLKKKAKMSKVLLDLYIKERNMLYKRKRKI